MATFGFWWPCWMLPNKMMFARLDLPRFLVCYSGHLSGNKSDEKAYVASCGWLAIMTCVIA